jgi:uncharacterized protein involved in type VI secretion and phage assembly
METKTPTAVRSYRVMVIADSSGQFCGNGMRYPTREAAEVAARDLFARWTLVTEWRVDESGDEPNA